MKIKAARNLGMAAVLGVSALAASVVFPKTDVHAATQEQEWEQVYTNTISLKAWSDGKSQTSEWLHIYNNKTNLALSAYSGGKMSLDTKVDVNFEEYDYRVTVLEATSDYGMDFRFNNVKKLNKDIVGSHLIPSDGNRNLLEFSGFGDPYKPNVKANLKIKFVIERAEPKEPEITDGEIIGGTDGKANVGIGSGEFTLGIGNAKNFGDVTIEKQPKKYTTGFDGKFNVADARGTQEGWRIDVEADQFRLVTPDGAQEGKTPYKLPKGTLMLSSLEKIERVGTGEGILPTVVNSGERVLDDGAVTVAQAGIGEGMGEFNLTFGDDALSMVVDATTAMVDEEMYGKSLTPYESTIKWSLVTAP